MGAIRIYDLHPRRGSFSTKTVNFNGTTFTVAAISIEQAFAVAHQHVWINPNDSHPVGVVSVCRIPSGLTLWCGCVGNYLTGGRVRRGMGVTALRAAIRAHHAVCPNRTLTLRERLFIHRGSES
jgi:hypothetical protein